MQIHTNCHQNTNQRDLEGHERTPPSSRDHTCRVQASCECKCMNRPQCTSGLKESCKSRQLSLKDYISVQAKRSSTAGRSSLQTTRPMISILRQSSNQRSLRPVCQALSVESQEMPVPCSHQAYNLIALQWEGASHQTGRLPLILQLLEGIPLHRPPWEIWS